MRDATEAFAHWEPALTEACLAVGLHLALCIAGDHVPGTRHYVMATGDSERYIAIMCSPMLPEEAKRVAAQAVMVAAATGGSV